MSDTGWVSPGTVVSDNSFGTTAWDNVNNTKLEDGNTASNTSFYYTSGDVVYGYTAKLVVNGSVTGDDLGVNEALPSSLTYKSLGGGSQLWGNSLDSSKVNGETFGFVVSYKNSAATTYTEYLKTTNYGFSVPTGATVDGVEVRVKHKATALEYGDYPEVDHIQIKVYYTEPTNTGWVSPSNTGETHNTWINPTNAYSSNDTYAITGGSTTISTSLSGDGGANYTTEKESAEYSATEETKELGGSTDTWGRTWSVSEFSNTNFRLKTYVSGTNYQDYYDFSLSIPVGSTIDGIIVSNEGKWETGAAGGTFSVDHIQIKVYYTESGTPTVGVKYPLPAFKRSSAPSEPDTPLPSDPM